MEVIDPRDLVTLNLKYASAAKPLRTLAFAQLAAKVLYLADKEVDARKLANKIAHILGVQRVSEVSVGEGLAFLRDAGKATESRGKWVLAPAARTEIEADVEQARSVTSGLLARHFPATLDPSKLRAWFLESTAKVFGQYGDEWVNSVCRGTRQGTGKLQPLAALLRPLARQYTLQDALEPLVNGFLAFLRSDDLADQQQLMALGQAMFSARLVAADIGADPITLEEFRDAIVLLDTNLIFAIVLEDHRLARSVKALARALKRIGVKPHYLRTTAEEYGRALSGVQRQLLPIVDMYPSEVLVETQNDFASTARLRGCKSRDDYERFFTSLHDMPTQMCDGVPLTLLEDEVIAKELDAGGKDTALKKRIQKLALERRPEWGKKPKSDPSLAHDAGLLHVTEGERTRHAKCWVLSLDRSLQTCAVQRAGPHSLPAVLSVDALVEILAVNEAGPGIDPSDFAPLLSRIILNECAPPTNTYTIEDLHWLRNINESVGELSADATKEIARVVAKARVEGTPVTDPQLQLRVNRMFQAKREEAERRLQDAHERARSAEGVAAQERAGRNAAQDELVRLKTAGRRRAAWGRLIKRALLRGAIAAVSAVAIGRLTWWLASGQESRALVTAALTVLSLFGGSLAWVWRPWREFRAEMGSAERGAKEDVYGGAD